MLPWEVLGDTTAPDGTQLSLRRRGGEYIIFANGKSLMSNRMHGSEEALATFGMAHLTNPTNPTNLTNPTNPTNPTNRSNRPPHVLVGGLGMGYTLRAALNHLPPDGIVTVAELLPSIIEWNRGPLGPLAEHPLKDPRVRIAQGDVADTLKANRRTFDAILLDVDNGPAAFTTEFNGGLYDNDGVATARAALRRGGTLAVWSAWDDRKFEQRLRYCGFTARVEHVRARLKQGGPRHTIFIGSLPG